MAFVIEHSYLIPLLPLLGAIVAGLFGAFQILSTRFSTEIAQLSRNGGHNLTAEYDAGVAKINSVLTTPASAEAVWLAAALAVVALAFAVTRIVEEL